MLAIQRWERDFADSCEAMASCSYSFRVPLMTVEVIEPHSSMPFFHMMKYQLDEGKKALQQSRLTRAGAELGRRNCWLGCPGPAASALFPLGRKLGCPLTGCCPWGAAGRLSCCARPAAAGDALAPGCCSTGALISLSASSVTGLLAYNEAVADVTHCSADDEHYPAMRAGHMTCAHG